MNHHASLQARLDSRTHYSVCVCVVQVKNGRSRLCVVCFEPVDVCHSGTTSCSDHEANERHGDGEMNDADDEEHARQRRVMQRVLEMTTAPHTASASAASIPQPSHDSRGSSSAHQSIAPVRDGFECEFCSSVYHRTCLDRFVLLHPLAFSSSSLSPSASAPATASTPASSPAKEGDVDEEDEGDRAPVIHATSSQRSELDRERAYAAFATAWLCPVCVSPPSLAEQPS